MPTSPTAAASDVAANTPSPLCQHAHPADEDSLPEHWPLGQTEEVMADASDLSGRASGHEGETRDHEMHNRP